MRLKQTWRWVLAALLLAMRAATGRSADLYMVVDLSGGPSAGSYYAIREDPVYGNDSRVDWPTNAVVNTNSFMGKLRVKTGLTGFDLPTEAPWEYACRAGTVTALNSGSNLTSLTSCPNVSAVGRYWHNGGSSGTQSNPPNLGTALVGTYMPNAWGLYDT